MNSRASGILMFIAGFTAVITVCLILCSQTYADEEVFIWSVPGSQVFSDSQLQLSGYVSVLPVSDSADIPDGVEVNISVQSTNEYRLTLEDSEIPYYVFREDEPAEPFSGTAVALVYNSLTDGNTGKTEVLTFMTTRADIDNARYTGKYTDVLTFTMSKRLPLGTVTAENLSAVYDGEPHSLNPVSCATDDTVIEYGEEPGVYTATDLNSVAHSRDSAGVTTVYYRVSKDGYRTAEGSYRVEVTRALAELSLTDAEITEFTGRSIDISGYISSHTGTVTYEIKDNGTTEESVLNGSVLTLGAMSSTDDSDQSVVINITDEGDLNHSSAAASLKIIVQKYTPLITFDNNEESIIYGDTLSVAAKASSEGGETGTLSYSLSEDTYLTLSDSTVTAIKYSGEKTTTVTAALSGTSTVRAVTVARELSVVKKNVIAAAPEIIDSLTYNGEEQKLANKGSISEGGVMYYCITEDVSYPEWNPDSWSEELPCKTAAGTYYIWYFPYVQDTEYYAGKGINTVQSAGEAVISKAYGSLCVMNGETLVADSSGISETVTVYAGTAIELISAGEGEGNIEAFVSCSEENTVCDVEITDSTIINITGITEGEAVITITKADSVNYFGASVTFTIEIIPKKTNPMTITTPQSLSLDLGIGYVSVERAANTVGTVTYSIVSQPSANYFSITQDGTKCKITSPISTPFGTYTVRLKVTDSGNDEYESKEITFTCKVEVWWRCYYYKLKEEESGKIKISGSSAVIKSGVPLTIAAKYQKADADTEAARQKYRSITATYISGYTFRGWYEFVSNPTGGSLQQTGAQYKLVTTSSTITITLGDANRYAIYTLD